MDAGRRRRVTLILAEDVVEEIRTVLRRSFRGHPALRTAFRLLEILCSRSEVVPRAQYADRVAVWAERVRDRKDAPILACAESVAADRLVSGDDDILALRGNVGLRILRTRELLQEIGEG